MDTLENNSNGHENEAPTSTIQRLNTLIEGAPVLEAAAQQAESNPALATAHDFDQLEEKRPFAHAIAPKIWLASGIALGCVLPFVGFFRPSSKSEQVTASNTTEDASATIPSETSPRLESLQAENETLLSQQAFTNQQLDMQAIEADGKRKQALAASQQQANATPTPARTTTPTAQPVAVRTPATPRPAPAPRATVRNTPAPAPRRTSAATVSEPIRREIPVDPYAQRTQLQALGVYGSPPPVSKTSYAATFAQNPFEPEDGYRFIQAVSLEQASVPPALEISQEVGEPAIEDTQYQEDASQVLNDLPREPSFSRTTEPTQPNAIMPGTSVTAEVPYGFQWREGINAPDVLLTTSEDIMAGDTVALPAGTQMLAKALIDPISGTTDLEIMVLFGEGDIQIPHSSIVVHADDGAPLVAHSSGGPSTPGPNFGGLLADSLANGLSNVIDSDDDVVVDLAGGVAEAIIENQQEAAEARANTRTARAAAQPITWTLAPGSVRLTFNNIIPLTTNNP